MTARVSPAGELLGAALRGGEVPRTLLVVAHPDDETVCASILMRRARHRLTLVHVTDGAPRDLQDARDHGFDTADEYAAAREAELSAALAALDLAELPRLSMSVPDREVHLHFRAVRTDLANIVRELRPELIVTHPYEGGHPDHDAVAAAVHDIARADATQACPAHPVGEFAAYNAWSGELKTLQFVPRAGAEELVEEGSASDLAAKRRALAEFRTQQRTLALFPLGPERYRGAASYDFLRPPHEGLLQYQRWWLDEIDWDRWARAIRPVAGGWGEARAC